MRHSRPNPAKGYPRRKVQRLFDALASETIAEDPNLVDRSQQTVMTAVKAMDNREFASAPDREKEPDGWMKRNRADVMIISAGLVAVSAVAGFVLGSSTAPAVRPPAVEVSVPAGTSTTPPLAPNPTPLPDATSFRPGE